VRVVSFGDPDCQIYMCLGAPDWTLVEENVFQTHRSAPSQSSRHKGRDPTATPDGT
jgi:hypothetical protein